MNKKIKIIDLLNKIANEEEFPKVIKYECYEYKWDDNVRDYICDDADGERLHMFDDGYICILCNNLNDEVEILGDNTEEIQELKYDVVDENGRGYFRLDTIADKVNELVRAVNQIRKLKES